MLPALSLIVIPAYHGDLILSPTGKLLGRLIPVNSGGQRLVYRFRLSTRTWELLLDSVPGHADRRLPERTHA